MREGKLLAVSAGGGLFPEDDDILPCGADRNGRHWLRVELSSTLVKYRTALTWQLWKRRPNGVCSGHLTVAFSRVSILSEGHRASQETVPKHGTLRAAAQKSTTHTKRC